MCFVSFLEWATRPFFAKVNWTTILFTWLCSCSRSLIWTHPKEVSMNRGRRTQRSFADFYQLRHSCLRIQGQAANICHLPPLGENFAHCPRGYDLNFPEAMIQTSRPSPFCRQVRTCFHRFVNKGYLFFSFLHIVIYLVVSLKACSAVSAFLGHFLDNNFLVIPGNWRKSSTYFYKTCAHCTCIE